SGELLVDSKFQSDRDYEYYNVIPEHVQCIRSAAKMPDNFSEFIYAATDVVVISVFFRNYSDKAACREYFEQLGELRIVEVSEFNLEIFSTDAGKGNALYKLAGMLGIDMSETIGIGDSDNDSSVTEAAGLGLAMSNSCDSLKEIADAVICSNEEHAVKYILENYFI
nr:HAD hydrolase family protein [Clostridia bacterium]